MSGVAVLFAGVDGGGSGTRLVAELDGRRAEVLTGPTALGLGVRQAWRTITQALGEAQRRLGCDVPLSRCRLVLGLSGANQSHWREAFMAAAPHPAALRLESDAFTTLIGAHGGAPGVIVALGTGSIGEALYADGGRVSVGGYGFPAGDEAGGAWLGLRASAHVQKVFDGRAVPDTLSRALSAGMGEGGEAVDSVAALVRWLSSADQTRFATLAPVLLAHPDHPLARTLLLQAGKEIALMCAALDPQGTLPLALCGGLAAPLMPWLPAPLSGRLVSPQGSSVEGALLLARNATPV
ncbi:BadF/BadG/BcrA/BcrD ATPase family protein [Kushneria aurantia]|uniref:BadF/BadG/BcrA/BcrD ATPase family protein n=1 Tax=Kushneria aurantia TaxID=504092 RepID=A0ABV6G2W3_9GAMM|nr:BadF/BadG/BcrA/BcrD ATPase family protein [Kushneria aurantia]